MSAFSLIQMLRCISCGREFEPGKTVYTCPDCGPLAGTLDVLYDIDRLRETFTPQLLRSRGDSTLWRYHELLPIRDPGVRPTLPVTVTPLYEPRGDLCLPAPRRLLVKDDTRQPSGSAKDRATVVGLAQAVASRARAVAAASTGNAASSLAAFAAHAALPCYIFAPADAPEAKLTQIRIHGAALFAVEGTYDEAFDLCTAVCERMGFYNRNTAINPYLSEGKKTIALEIFEQLGYRAPDVVVVPVGDGCILGGVYKGFRDLREAKLIERMPRLVGVQATGSAALAHAWEQGRERCQAAPAASVADSICVAMPRDQIKALRAVRESQGFFVTVSDEAILGAQATLAGRAGIFAEPAAAASLAGLASALAGQRIKRESEVVLLLTGHGLKDIGAAQQAAAPNAPIRIPPELGAAEAALAKISG
jgi:threonine synthase